MPTKRLPWGKRIAFSLGAVAIVIALTEGIVYMVYRPPMGVPPTAAIPTPAAPDVRPGREEAGLGFRDPSMAIHPYLGYVFLPADTRAEGEPPPRVSISEDGFLDERPAVRRRDDTRVLVGVMGGSVAGQLGSYHAEHLARALRPLPEVRGREPEFVWLGMPGYHQPQQLIQLCYLLAQGGELDLLVNLDGFNELAVPGALNAPQGAHPLYPMNWSMVALDVPDPEVRRLIGAIEYLQSERAARTEKFRRSLWSRSPAATVLWKIEDDALARTIAHHAWRLQELPVEDIPYFVRGPERAHVPVEEMIPALVEVWKSCSLQMHALCAANDIRYLHCLQPNQYDPGSKPLSAAERREAFDAESPYRAVVETGYPHLRTAGAELREAGVAFHDLSQVFADVDETLYVDSCCHFNGDGNRILAQAIGAAAGASF